MTSRRIVLAGGSGFLGQALADSFQAQSFDVVVLTRAPQQPTSAARHVHWDGRTVAAWAAELEGAAAIVNLAGKSVNCRYTPANRREIVASRVDSVRVLAQAIARCADPPPVWVQSGSLAIYGNAGERICDEDAPIGHGFSVETCIQWERAFAEAQTPQTRKTLLRIGFVLGQGGGALDSLANLTRRFLGGAVGNGKQYISWLHVADFNRMVAWIIDNHVAEGIYNATGPNPVTNATFMRALRHALRRPWSPPTPTLAVRIGARLMGTEAELALTGRRCVPRRLHEQGFTFTYPELEGALQNALSPRPL